MTNRVKLVSFVCMANYCRSPVAMILFKNKYGSLLNVDSAGINPIISAGMDSRSIDYLKEKKIPSEIHNPKKIDKSLLNSSDIVFAMDPVVLMNLNKTFKKYRTKLKLFSYQHRNLKIKDPYKLSKDKYKEVMNEINFVVESFKLEELF